MRIVHSLVCMGLSLAAPAFATVTVTSPTSGATTMSPVSYAATATTTCSKGVGSMGIYVNNKLTYVVNGAKLSTTLSLAPGTYSTVVEEWDHCGGASYTKIPITVSSSGGGGGGGGGKPGVTVSSPAANSTVTSPVSYVATATTSCAKGVASMGIYVNNKLVYVVSAASLNKSLSLANGAEHTVVEEWDKCGGAAYTTVNLTVSSSPPPPKQVTAIAVTPSDPSVTVGGTEQFTATATYSDSSTANVTSTATWAVANTGVAAITSGGLATGEAVGSTQVTASLSGITGSDPFNVTAAASAAESMW